MNDPLHTFLNHFYCFNPCAYETIPLIYCFYFLTEKRLTAAKRKAEEVVEHVSGIPKKEASSRDVALIHFFMLENVHWFYRISLRMNLLGRQFCLFI